MSLELVAFDRKPSDKFKRFVRRHRFVILLGTIAGAAITVQAQSIRRMNDFLEENDLLEEYYGSDDMEVAE